MEPWALGLPDDLRALREIYDDAGRQMAAWARQVGLGCPQGCGICCEGFVPDVLPVEAGYLASWLLAEQPQRVARLLERPPGPAPAACPLYDPAAPAAHCTVYPGRPLVCRLFGYAGMRTRHGGWAFRLCRHMPAPDGWDARAVADRPDLPSPPVMGDIQAQVPGLRPGDAPFRRPLPDALREALQRLLLRRARSSG